VIDRGYENFTANLKSLGAEIEIVQELPENLKTAESIR
jgi:UDP-N-acetylglucosamine enolpyruvyl transferase